MPPPKEEANYEQWLFWARGTLNSHTEETVQSGIIRSVRGEVRELVGFTGFQADLMGHTGLGRGEIWEGPYCRLTSAGGLPAGARENRKGPAVHQPFGAEV